MSRLEPVGARSLEARTADPVGPAPPPVGGPERRSARDLVRHPLAGPVAAAVAAGAWCTFAAVVEPGRVGVDCPFLALTGLACPGCGSTRALHQLARGDVGAAVGFNVLAVAVLPVLLYSWSAWVGRATGRWRWRSGADLPPWAVVATGVVLVGFGVVRNVGPFSALAP